jgi:hypothetical protein
MKGSRVFILLVMAIAFAAFQHTNKKNEQGDRIDRLATGLKEVEKYLPPNASVTLKMPESAPPESYMLWRFLLAPRYCSIHPRERFDTVLAIINVNANDSVIHSIVDDRKVICSSNDGQYKYFLTCNHR